MRFNSQLSLLVEVICMLHAKQQFTAFLWRFHRNIREIPGTTAVRSQGRVTGRSATNLAKRAHESLEIRLTSAYGESIRHRGRTQMVQLGFCPKSRLS